MNKARTPNCPGQKLASITWTGAHLLAVLPDVPRGTGAPPRHVIAQPSIFTPTLLLTLVAVETFLAGRTADGADPAIRAGTVPRHVVAGSIVLAKADRLTVLSVETWTKNTELKKKIIYVSFPFTAS